MDGYGSVWMQMENSMCRRGQLLWMLLLLVAVEESSPKREIMKNINIATTEGSRGFKGFSCAPVAHRQYDVAWTKKHVNLDVNLEQKRFDYVLCEQSKHHHQLDQLPLHSNSFPFRCIIIIIVIKSIIVDVHRGSARILVLVHHSPM